jgi:hypothetical protein
MHMITTPAELSATGAHAVHSGGGGCDVGHDSYGNEQKRRTRPTDVAPFDALDVRERQPLRSTDQGVRLDCRQLKIQGPAVTHPDADEVVRPYFGDERLFARKIDRAHRPAAGERDHDAQDRDQYMAQTHALL